MVSPTLESIVWLMFSKFKFPQIVSYFPCSKHDFENYKKGEKVCYSLDPWKTQYV